MALKAGPLGLSAAGLDELYASSPAGEIPVGRGSGTVVFAPGTRFARPLAAVARALLWQGKVFRPDTHDLLNLLTPLGRMGVRAEVRIDPSRIDGQPCIVLDYAKSSKVARKIRDEIRPIGPDEYLGVVFRGDRQMRVYFLLRFAGAAS